MKKIAFFFKKVMIILSTILILGNTIVNAQKGIVVVSIADLAGEPIQTYYSALPSSTCYQKLPWAHYRKDYQACPRVHQLLYQEIVEVLGKKNDELLVRVPNVFYQKADSASPQNYYWTLTKNILPLKNLVEKNVDLTKIPQPIHFHGTNQECYRNTVSLIEPYTVPSMDITLSAGTRLIQAKEQTDKDMVMVYCLHPTKHVLETIAIPRTSVYVFQSKPMRERITDFLAILRRWTKQNDGIIPYVWGGCSFVNRHAKNEFVLEKKEVHGKMLGYYVRPEHTKIPKTGYDCSSIIARAAQIVGLPYHYKNTYTIARQLPLIAPHEHLKEGDLIWVDGHVLIVANIKENTVIEASGYDYGFGEVHEIAIGKVFKNVATFDELHRCYRQKKAVARLHLNGTVLDTYKEVRLFKFASQWV